MDISTLRENTKEITVSLGAGTIVAAYYPGRYTRKLQRDIAAKEKALQAKVDAGDDGADADDVNGIAEMVVALLASWDLTDGGKPVPITEETLVDALGYIYTLAILRAILDDVTAGTGGAGLDPNSKTPTGKPR
jgi:hypothetical protein